MNNNENLNSGHDDPVNWKWGIFYYNKNDHRILPPKKNKAMGWTVNFANPYSMLGLSVITILAMKISKYFKAKDHEKNNLSFLDFIED